MKSIAILLLGLALCIQNTNAQKTIKIDKMPSTIEDFLTLRNEISKTPEGGAALFVAAMHMYTKDKTIGNNAFTIASDRSLLKETGEGHKGFAPAGNMASMIKNYFAPKPYLAASYFAGTSPKNGYQLPSAPYKVVLTRNTYSTQPNGDIKVFVKCSGADSPRPVTLRKNNRGIWKVINYSSLFVGIRKPAVDDGL
ncbi:MAG: hypothetical protein GY810_31520 [Aureispira sp.]|nr:hypothetical protein [Aureispira sp.]